MDPITLLVISSPHYPFLRFLDRLPQPVTVHTGNDLDFLKQHAPEADVILNGFHDGSALRAILPLAERVKWIHALSAGVEKVLSPELIESPVPLTNGRGVFGPALAEFAIAAMLLLRQRSAPLDSPAASRALGAVRRRLPARSDAGRRSATAASDAKRRAWPTRSA